MLFILLSALILGNELSGNAADIQEETEQEVTFEEPDEEEIFEDEPYEVTPDQEDPIIEESDLETIMLGVSATSSTGTVAPSKPGQWLQGSDGRWWYKHNDGTYTENAWEKINNKWYHFDSSGWMQTGWLNINIYWFYLGGANDGAMKTGWQKVNGKWYYMASSGIMQTGWIQVNGKRYYLNSSGVMQTGWIQLDSKWYYLQSTGAMKTGWLSLNGKQYYFSTSGVMQTGWVKISGIWYYFQSSGGRINESRKSVTKNYKIPIAVIEGGWSGAFVDMLYTEWYVSVGTTKYYTKHETTLLYNCSGATVTPTVSAISLSYSNGTNVTPLNSQSTVYDGNKYTGCKSYVNYNKYSLTGIIGTFKSYVFCEGALPPMHGISVSQSL